MYLRGTKNKTMATYECSNCGMAVNASCAKCNQPLEHDILTLDNGSEVQISICRSCEGKIKSPQCCGSDMSCSA
jgi:hypothetical protein